uniref:Cingulin n=1 Tax=Sphenodon punctatus TaxID=8508 RepID=A0A8D0G6G6_SPHPU
MDPHVNGTMGEKHSPMDYGVQIRFINDLKETNKPQKIRPKSSKSGSYGVAVRVQGIDGQPFVVLNSGEKGGDSFGVQIKSENNYGTVSRRQQFEKPPFSSPKETSGSISSDSDLPENPYAAKRSQYHSQGSTSDEELGSRRYSKAAKSSSSETARSYRSNGASSPRGSYKPQPPRKPFGEELRRTRSHGSLLSPDSEEPYEPSPSSTQAGGTYQSPPVGDAVRSLAVRKRPDQREQGNNVSGLRPVTKQPSSDAESSRPPQPADKGGGDIDTKPLSSVDSLISKFDGKVQQRGRAARRSRLSPDERKRSQSLDGRVSYRDTVDSRELSVAEHHANHQEDGPKISGTNSLNRTRQEPKGNAFSKSNLTRDWLNKGLEEPQPCPGLSDLKSTPDLLKDQQEVSQPGTSNSTKELIYSILKEGSGPPRSLEKQLEEMAEECGRLRQAFEKKSQEMQTALQEVKLAKGQAEAKLGDLEEQLMEMHEELDRLRESSGGEADRDALLKELLDTREGLSEVLSTRQKQEEHLHQRERELTALKGALKEEVANHDKELDRVRQQCQRDMDQLRRNMENVTQDQAGLEAERQKINSVMRHLQRELEESSEETGHWREMFQKNKEELRSTKQELMQVNLEREELEEELREVQERFSVMRQEVDQVRSSSADTGEAEALQKELREAREELRELLSEKEAQDELLHQKERELAALKGALKEEVAGHDREMEQLKQQFQKNAQQLRKEYEAASKVKVVLESEKEATEQVRKAVESTLRETQEENDDLRREILGLEMQLKEFRHFAENWQSSEARLKEKVARLEADRKQMEESLGDATDQEQELVMARRSLESRLEEAQRSLARLCKEHQELSACYQEQAREKEQLKRAKVELEEQKRLLDKTIQKLTQELDQMAEESHSSLSLLQSQLEEYKEKSRKEITDAQKQAKDRNTEVEKTQFNMGRLQDEILRLKQALQDSQAERENAVLDKELVAQLFCNLEQEVESKKRSQDDRSRQVKALEDKAKRLEVEVDEERSTVELLSERINRSRDQIDQLRAELLQERSSRQDLECDKISLERQNKDLKGRLASSEGLQKPSANLSQLESRLQELQDKLQVEEREKSILVSSNRKLERKVKELTIQIDDERQHVNDQKDQLSLRVKTLKRQVDEAEEEIERLENARKKAQRELEEQHELNEELQNRVKNLEKDSWRKTARSTAESSLKDDHLSSDEEEFDSAYGPSSIASLLTEANLQTSSC